MIRVDGIEMIQAVAEKVARRGGNRMRRTYTILVRICIRILYACSDFL